MSEDSICIKINVDKFPMDKTVSIWRDLLSPGQQSMIDSGEYELFDEDQQPLNIDNLISSKIKSTKNNAAKPKYIVISRYKMQNLWIGYFPYISKTLYYLYLSKESHVYEKKLLRSIELLEQQGFAVDYFKSKEQLKKTSENHAYLNYFDQIGIISDSIGIQELLSEGNHELIQNLTCNSSTGTGRLLLMACLFDYKTKKTEKLDFIEDVSIQSSILAASVDISLIPKLICEELILTLYCDSKMYPNLCPAKNKNLDSDAIRETYKDFIKMVPAELSFIKQIKDNYLDFLRSVCFYLPDTNTYKERPASIEPTILKSILCPPFDRLPELNTRILENADMAYYFKKCLDILLLKVYVK